MSRPRVHRVHLVFPGAACAERSGLPGYSPDGEYAQVKRRVWDLNPRGRVNALAVFKTAAIGH